MKIFLSIGNESVENKIREYRDIDVIDSESNLDSLYDLLEFIEIDFLIINRLLYNDKGDIIFKIAQRAKSSNIKIIMLMDNISTKDEKKLITKLAAEEVYCFLKLEDLNEEKLLNCMNNYPEEFNFNFLSNSVKDEIKDVKELEKEIVKPVIIEKERTVIVKQEVIDNGLIVVFSNKSLGASLIATALSQSFVKEYNVTLVNLDKSNSANLYFNIESPTSLKSKIKANKFLNLVEESYKPVDGLNIITGGIDENVEITLDKLNNLLNVIRSKSNIVILDCSEVDDISKSLLCQSSSSLIVFDTSLYHVVADLKEIENLKKDNLINFEKTIAIINNFNNVDYRSSDYVLIKNKLEDCGFNKILDVGNIKNINETMEMKKPFYLDDMKEDIEKIMFTLKSRNIDNKTPGALASGVFRYFKSIKNLLVNKK